MYTRTRLQTQQASDTTLYLPLARLTSLVNERRAGSNLTTWPPPFEEAVARYVEAIGAGVGAASLTERFRHGRVVLLVDGVDEVIRSAPWILDAIRSIAVRFPGMQVVTSSRMSGEYLEQIPFVALTLLPFTDKQRDQFIRQWFLQDAEEGSLHIQRIQDHLTKHRKIGDIVRSPLLATMLCVLEENKVPLPDSEIKLYSSRLSLLLGYYDIHKQVARLRCPKELLELVARRLAFALHLAGKKEEDREWLCLMAKEGVRDEATDRELKLAVDELIDPCNILVPMTEDGKLGFGHLRYQEHLAAFEIMHNRGIDIGPFLAQPWWMGVFILFAKMNQSIEWLIHSSTVWDRFPDCERTIMAMIGVRPTEERTRLRGIVKKMRELSGDEAPRKPRSGSEQLDQSFWPTEWVTS
jgi:hypothetical protein